MDSDRFSGLLESAMRLRCFVLLVLLAVAPARASKYEFASLKVAVTHGDYGYRFVGRPRTKDFVLEAAVKTTAHRCRGVEGRRATDSTGSKLSSTSRCRW